MKRLVLATAALLLALWPSAGPAWAGGSSVYTVQDRYEAGDLATLVGYVSPAAAGGWVGDGPYFAYADIGPDRRAALGRLGIEPTRFGAGMMRVSLTFEVPSGLAAGRYDLTICNDRCARGLGDLAGGTLNVGIDPVRPIVREWPPDEFEIVNLPPGDTTTWPASPVTPAATTATSAAPAPPTLARATAAPAHVPSPSHDASPIALALGGTLAAVCVGLVLVALREG